MKIIQVWAETLSIFEAGPQSEVAIHMATIKCANIIAAASLAARAMHPSGEG